MTGSRSAAIAAVLVLAACETGGAEGEHADGGQAGAPWTLVTSAQVRIGGAADGSDALFMVTAAARLDDGRIVVADAGNHRVEVFDSAGGKVRSLGRAGRGPGEMSHPSWIAVRADTVLVWDMVQARLTRFDTAGTLISTGSPVTDLGSFPRIAGQRQDGSLLAVASAAAEWRPGAHRDSLRIVWLKPDGGRDTVATVPGDEQFGTRSPDRRVTETTTLPFGRRTLVATHGDRVYLGTADAPLVVASRTGAGGWDTVARVPGSPRPVYGTDVDDYWKKLRVAGPQGSVSPPAGIDYPAHYPPYTDLRISASGDVWLLLPSRPAEWSVSSRWVVFSPAGVLRGRVEIPGRNRVLQVGDGWILVVETGADDRENVAQYTVRPG